MDNFESIQPNCKDDFIINNEDILTSVKALPYTFYNNYIKYRNNGNKVICPKFILYNISNYENVCFPITIKIKDTYLGVLEFVDFIDEIYIPNNIFYLLDLEENQEIPISILHKNIVKGTFIKIKPQLDDFYFIENKKQYLEIHLKNLYSTLTKDTLISIPYKDKTIPFLVTECMPENTISIVDVDELEVDIEPINEKKISFTEVKNDNENATSTEDEIEVQESNKFPGEGRKLND